MSILCCCRPTSCEVASHCFFWTKSRKLAFFQDVSDRVEKEPFTSPIVQALERGGLSVVKRDWRENITEDLKEGDSMDFVILSIQILILACVHS